MTVLYLHAVDASKGQEIPYEVVSHILNESDSRVDRYPERKIS